MQTFGQTADPQHMQREGQYRRQNPQVADIQINLPCAREQPSAEHARERGRPDHPMHAATVQNNPQNRHQRHIQTCQKARIGHTGVFHPDLLQHRARAQQCAHECDVQPVFECDFGCWVVLVGLMRLQRCPLAPDQWRNHQRTQQKPHPRKGNRADKRRDDGLRYKRTAPRAGGNDEDEVGLATGEGFGHVNNF